MQADLVDTSGLPYTTNIGRNGGRRAVDLILRLQMGAG